MHPARLLGRGSKGVRAAAEPHPNALGLAQVTKLQSALLARISQFTTASTREQFAGEVQHCNSPPAVSAVGADRTDKPRPSAAEMTGRACNRQPLFDRFPPGQKATRPVDQHHRTHLRARTLIVLDASPRGASTTLRAMRREQGQRWPYLPPYTIVLTARTQ